MPEGFSLSVHGSVQAMTRDLSDLQRRVVPNATASALNKVNGKLRTAVARDLAGRFKLSARDSKRRIVIPRTFRASRRKLRTGGIVAVFIRKKDAPEGIEHFFEAGKPQLRTSQPRFAVRTSGGRKGKRRGGGKHSGIFIRMGRPRLPIKEIFTDQTEVALRGIEMWHARNSGEWNKIFSRELNFRLMKQRGRR